MATSRFRVLFAPVLLAPLLVGCYASGGHVGAVATGHFTAQHRFPVVIVTWCGDDPPRQIDLAGESRSLHLVATREFGGSELEVDLAAPGEDWEILDEDGRAVYRMGPESPDEEYTLGVGSAEAEPGEPAEHDIGTLTFTTGALAAEQGVYTEADGASAAAAVPQEEFPPEC
jgi:hypothetical protein